MKRLVVLLLLLAGCAGVRHMPMNTPEGRAAHEEMRREAERMRETMDR
jgi:hypothetical protein